MVGKIVDPEWESRPRPKLIIGKITNDKL